MLSNEKLKLVDEFIEKMDIETSLFDGRIVKQIIINLFDEYAEEYVFLQALLDCVTSGDHHVYLNEHEMLMLNKEYV